MPKSRTAEKNKSLIAIMLFLHGANAVTGWKIMIAWCCEKGAQTTLCGSCTMMLTSLPRQLTA